eukprot:13900633-Heterocapsa_arctica.AAC.1
MLINAVGNASFKNMPGGGSQRCAVISVEAGDVKYDGIEKECTMTVMHAPKEAKRVAFVEWDPMNPAKTTFIGTAPGQRLHRYDLIPIVSNMTAVLL